MPAIQSSPSPFHIYTDPDDSDSLGLHTDENEPYIDNGAYSRRQSGYTAISSIPPSLPPSDLEFLPHKNRRAFRSPSSVRALQLSSPSPLASPRLKPDTKNRTWRAPARDRDRAGAAGAAGSIRAGSLCDSGTDVDSMAEEKMLLRQIREQRRDDDEHHRDDYLHTDSGRATPLPTPHRQAQTPLILLHVSALPCPLPEFSLALLEAHAPRYVAENFHLLRQKMSDVVLARGILVPHPGEEYDLLEERLLEALELCTPRVLGCGHFRGDEHDGMDDDDDAASITTATTLLATEGTSPAVQPVPRAICDYAHGDAGTEGFEDVVCDTCTQAVRHPSRGAGYGKRRWDVKFYASNGLMGSGAWSAAWREMERVDVEITPWMPEDVRRALERAAQQEAKEAEEKERVEHEAREARECVLDKLQTELDSANLLTARVEASLHKAEAEILRLAAVAASAAQMPIQRAPAEAVDVPIQRPGVRATVRATNQPTHHREPNFDAAKDVPLSHLLFNYVCILAQDKRNLAMAALSCLVLLLSMSILGRSTNPADISPHIPTITVHHPLPSVSSSSFAATIAAPSDVASSMHGTLLLDTLQPHDTGLAPTPPAASSSSSAVIIPSSAPAASGAASLRSTASVADARAHST